MYFSSYTCGDVFFFLSFSSIFSSVPGLKGGLSTPTDDWSSYCRHPSTLKYFAPWPVVRTHAHAKKNKKKRDFDINDSCCFWEISAKKQIEWRLNKNPFKWTWEILHRKAITRLDLGVFEGLNSWCRARFFSGTSSGNWLWYEWHH